MHNHQKSQIESRRGAVHFTLVVLLPTTACYRSERVIDYIYIDTTGQHMNCFQHL